MFNFSNWLTKGIIDGYQKGYTPFFKVTELTAAYVLKGLLSQTQAEEIMKAIPVPQDEMTVHADEAL